MKISGIYKIQSISHPERCYIGSAVDMSKRWSHHLTDLRKNQHHSSKLQRHINKYGIADLQFNELAVCNTEELRPINKVIWIEQFFIDAYKPYFNICKVAGSCLGFHHSEDAKNKISVFRKGKSPWCKGRKLHPHSEEAKQKMREKKIGCIPWNKGKKSSAETIQNLRDSHRGLRSWRKINIIQYDKNMNFICEWDSATDAARALPVSSKNISYCLRGKGKSAGGFIWEYKFNKQVA